MIFRRIVLNLAIKIQPLSDYNTKGGISLENVFDEILRYGSEQEKRKLFEQNRKDIQKITDRVHRIAADEHIVRRRVI